MLLGRLKNALLTHGVEPQIGTPVTVLGEHLALPASTSGMSSWQRLLGADVDVFVRLDVTFASGFAFLPADESRSPTTREGEMVLF